MLNNPGFCRRSHKFLSAFGLPLRLPLLEDGCIPTPCFPIILISGPTMIDTQRTAEEEHMIHMQKALKEALSDDCIPVQSAFCVGCVLVARLPGIEPVTLATGYSRELPGNTHAEANSLTKAFSLSKPHLAALFSSVSPTPSIEGVMRYTDVYTTLEPCSVRTSGLPACADALIKAGIKRCIIGVGEPDDFVKCEGAQKLKGAAIDVVWLRGLEKQCLDAARRGHNTKE